MGGATVRPRPGSGGCHAPGSSRVAVTPPRLPSGRCAMASYAEQVGERLRNIRLQKGLSLHDVEERSVKEFKASVLGAYERGERSISVPRLQRLAIFYGVPVDPLLPRLAAEPTDGAGAATPEETALCIHLEALEARREPEARTLGRYLSLIQMQRGDF